MKGHSLASAMFGRLTMVTKHVGLLTEKVSNLNDVCLKLFGLVGLRFRQKVLVEMQNLPSFKLKANPFQKTADVQAVGGKLEEPSETPADWHRR